MASGICADTNCLRVETRYPPGGTSPGSVSGNWSTDLGRDGWSTSFKHRRHSDDAIDLTSYSSTQMPCFLFWHRIGEYIYHSWKRNLFLHWINSIISDCFHPCNMTSCRKDGGSGNRSFPGVFTDCSTVFWTEGAE